MTLLLSVFRALRNCRLRDRTAFVSGSELLFQRNVYSLSREFKCRDIFAIYATFFFRQVYLDATSRRRDSRLPNQLIDALFAARIFFFSFYFGARLSLQMFLGETGRNQRQRSSIDRKHRSTDTTIERSTFMRINVYFHVRLFTQNICPAFLAKIVILLFSDFSGEKAPRIRDPHEINFR